MSSAANGNCSLIPDLTGKGEAGKEYKESGTWSGAQSRGNHLCRGFPAVRKAFLVTNVRKTIPPLIKTQQNIISGPDFIHECGGSILQQESARFRHWPNKSTQMKVLVRDKASTPQTVSCPCWSSKAARWECRLTCLQPHGAGSSRALKSVRNT